MLLALILGSQADPARAASCKGANRDTVAETSGVRVYRVPGRDEASSVFACLKRNGRTTFLWFHGEDVERYFVKPVRIKGPLVAYGEGTIGREQYTGTAVVIVDTRTRRSVFTHTERPYTKIRDLELARTGTVGWIAEDGAGNHPVRMHDAAGTVTLDDGSGVDPASLTRTESELHWTKNGEPRSAPFR